MRVLMNVADDFERMRFCQPKLPALDSVIHPPGSTFGLSDLIDATHRLIYNGVPHHIPLKNRSPILVFSLWIA